MNNESSTDTIQCCKLKQQLPALQEAPYPGEIGQRILENVSQPAWAQWMEAQTILINEHRLNLLDASSREFLKAEMLKFLFE